MAKKDIIDRILTTKEAALYCGFRSDQTLRAKRMRNEAPGVPYVRLGTGKNSRIGYWKSDLDRYLRGQTFESTHADPAMAAGE